MPITFFKKIFPVNRYTTLLAGMFLVSSAAVSQEFVQYLASGDSLLKIEKPQRALEAYDKAVKADANAATYLGRAKANYALNRSDRFLLDVEQAIRMDSTLAEAHYLRSIYALRAQDMHKASHHAGKAIEHTTDEQLRARSHIVRGLGLAELRSPAKAISDLEHGSQAGIEDLEAMRVLARLYDGAGRYEDALRILEKLTELEPGEVGHWSNRAFELIQLDRHEEALVMIDKALSIDKDEPVALSNRAFIFFHMSKYKEATQDIDRSLRYFPANPYALRTRALLRLQKGERIKACEDLTLAKVLGNIAEVDALVKEHCASTPAR